MICIFNSESAGDLVMPRPNADQVPRILDKETSMTGIIEPERSR